MGVLCRPGGRREVVMATERDRGIVADAEGEPNVYALLGAHARGVPDGRLAAYAGVGVLALGAGLFARPAWGGWLLLLPLMALGALGTWGIADRELGGPAGAAPERPGRRRALALVKGGAAALGTAAAAAAAFGFLAVALGRLIS
jgi:hypothetical protein